MLVPVYKHGQFDLTEVYLLFSWAVFLPVAGVRRTYWQRAPLSLEPGLFVPN